MSVGEAVRWTLPSLDCGSADESRGAADTTVVTPEPDTVADTIAPASVFDLDQTDSSAASSSEDDLNGKPGDDSAGADASDDALHAADQSAKFELDRAAAREAGHTEGFEAGRAEGHAAGLAQGRAEALAQCEGDTAALRELLSYLATPLEQLDDALEAELVALSTAIARQLVRRELQTAPGEIVPVVREALAVLPSSQRDVTVSLHPEDAAFVRNALSGKVEADAWQIAEDPLLSRGGCRIAAGHSHVDATLESRLNAVAVSLSTRSRSDD